MRRWFLTIAVAPSLLLLATAASAGEDTKYHFGVGASLPQGDTADFLDDGWALHFGATWFKPDRPIGVRLDFGVDWWDVSNEVLSTIDTDGSTPIVVEPPDDGDARAWQLAGNFVWDGNRGKDRKVGFYLTGGGGVYYTSYDISEDGLVGTYWCDWWWGVCYPTIVEGEYLIQSGDSWEVGLNAGAGVTFQMRSGAEIYLEALYHWVDTEGSAEYVPITIGVRW